MSDLRRKGPAYSTPRYGNKKGDPYSTPTPDAQTEVGKGIQQGLRNFTAGLTATRGVIDVLAGNEEQGVARLEEAKARQEDAAKNAPRINSFLPTETSPGVKSAGDFVQFAANTMATQLPNLATAIVPGGAGAMIGKSIATNGMRKVVQNQVADQVAAGVKDRVIKRTAAQVGSTIGGGVGAAAGGTQMELGQLAPEMVLDDSEGAEGTVRERTNKALVGSAAAGSIEAFPTLMMLKRIGLIDAAKPAIRRSMGQVAKNMLKEGGKQALAEGATEGGQTVIERMARKWVNNNIGLLTPDAFHEYINATVAGAVTGGPLGTVTAFQLPSGSVESATESARKGIDSVKSKLKTDGPKQGERMDPAAPTARMESRSFEEAYNNAYEKLGDKDFDTQELYDFDDEEEGTLGGDPTDAFLEEGETEGQGQEVEGTEAAYEGEYNADADLAATRDRSRKYQSQVFRGLVDNIDDVGVEALRKAFSGAPRKGETSLTKVTEKREALTNDEAAALKGIEEQLKTKYGADWPEVVSQLQQYTQNTGNRYAREMAEADVRRKAEDYGAGITNVDKKDLVSYPKSIKDSAFKSLLRSARDMGVEGAHDALELAEKNGKLKDSELPVAVRQFMEKALPSIQKKLGRPVAGVAGLAKVQAHEIGPPAGMVAGTRADGTQVWVKLDEAVGQARKKGVTTDDDGNVSGEYLSDADALAEAVSSLAEQGITIPKLRRDQIVRMDLTDPNDVRSPRRLVRVRDLEAQQEGKARSEMMQPVEDAEGNTVFEPRAPLSKAPDGPFEALPIEEQLARSKVGADAMTRSLQPQTRGFSEGSDNGETTADLNGSFIDPKADFERGASVFEVANGDKEPVTNRNNSNEDLKNQRKAVPKATKQLLDQELDSRQGKVELSDMQGRVEAAPEAGPREKSAAVPTKTNSPVAPKPTRTRSKIHTDIQEHSENIARADEVLTNDFDLLSEAEELGLEVSEMREIVEHQRRKDLRAIKRLQKELEATPRRKNFRDDFLTENPQALTQPYEVAVGFDEKGETIWANVAEDSDVDTVPVANRTFTGELSENMRKLLRMTRKTPRIPAAALSRISKEMLAKLGIQGDVRVVLSEQEFTALTNPSQQPFSKTLRGAMWPKQVNGQWLIYINPSYSKEVQLQVLAHETGHIVIKDAIAQARKRSDANAPIGEHDKLLNEVMKEFTAWRDKHYAYGAKVLDAKADGRSALPDIEVLVRNLEEVSLGLGRERLVSEMPAEERQYLFDFEEWFAEQIAKAANSNAEVRGVFEKFFKQIADRIKAMYEAWSGELNVDPAPSVDAFIKQLVLDGHKLARKRERSVAFVEQYVQDGRLSSEEVAGVVELAAPGSVQANVLFRERFRKLDRASRKVLENVFNRKPVIDQLNKLLEGDAAALAEINDPAVGLEARVAFGYRFWQLGQLELNKFENFFRELSDDVTQIFGVNTDSNYAAQLLEDIATGKVTTQNYSVFERMNKDANVVSKFTGAIREIYLNRFEPTLLRFFSGGISERLRDTNNPALIRLALKFKPKSGDQTHDIGMFQARHVAAAEFHGKLANILEGKTDEQKQAWREAGIAGNVPVELKEYLDQLYHYMQDAGVKFPYREDFFPVEMLEPQLLEQRKEDFFKLFAQDKFRGAMQQKLRGRWAHNGLDQKKRAEVVKRIADMTNDQLAQQFFDMAKGPEYVQDPDWVQGMKPAFESMNDQLMSFMRGDLATAEEKVAFASLQDPDLAQVLTRYAYKATLRAEFHTRFGDEGIAGILAEASSLGASEAELAMAKDFADVMMGSYGIGLNPTVHKLVSHLDNIFGTHMADNPEAIKKWNGYLVVYQNIRTLPLALLSSIVDPLGIGIRSSSMTEAVRAMRDTVKTVFKSKDMDAIQALAEAIGAVDVATTNEMLAQLYSTYGLSPGARKLSDAFFKATGLSQWTRATRVAAFASGMRFLAQHADGKHNAHSERYLKELGLRPGQVKVAADGSINMGNPAVQSAVLRYVDEAVLRPDPSQRPLWMSDPNWQVITQYKSFVYAFQDTILRRISVETANGNYKVLAIAAMYVPVMLMSELLREFLQHGAEGDPMKEQWGLMDYSQHAFKRTGMLGTKEMALDAMNDPKYGRLPGMSLLGPTVSQTRDVFSEKPKTRFIREALPAAALHEDWGDGNMGEETEDSGSDKP